MSTAEQYLSLPEMKLKKHPVSLMLSWGCEEQWQEAISSKSADLMSGSLFS